MGLATEGRADRGSVGLGQLLLQYTVVEVLDPLVARLEIIGLQVEGAAACDDRHAQVVELLGQAVALEHVRRRDADLDVYYVVERYAAYLALLTGSGGAHGRFSARVRRRDDRERLFAPDELAFVARDVDEAGVGLAPPPVLDEHLPSLHHLDIVVLGEGLLGVKVEERANSAEDPLDVLRVCLELVGADPVVHLLELGRGVARRSL